MKNIYRTSEGDSHPNGPATDLVAPQFVNEIFDAAISYEAVNTNIQYNNPTCSGFNIYPNPSRNQMNIEFINPAKPINISITTTNGQKVYSKTIRNLPANIKVENINLSGFSKGIYFVQIQNGNNTETKKLIIQ